MHYAFYSSSWLIRLCSVNYLCLVSELVIYPFIHIQIIVFHINTGSKHQHHKPSGNLSCFQKNTFCAVIKISNSLPVSLTILENNKAKCKEIIRKYLSKYFLYSVNEFFMCKDLFWSLWLHGLRRGSAADRLLGLWVRIQLVVWMLVSCECCMLSGRGFCDELIACPEESYRVWCVWIWS